MNSRVCLALAAVAVLFVAGVAAGDISLDVCYENTVSSPQEALGTMLVNCPLGLPDDQHQASCCPSALEVFGDESPLASCLCQADYFTLLVGSIPEDIDVEKLFDGLTACGVSIRGSDKCGGEAGPLVESQLLIKATIAKKLFLKKALGKAVLLKG